MNDCIPAPETRMTLRDHFASLVTAEVPNWFEPAPYIRLELPPIPEGLDENLAYAARQYDEPDGLSEGQVQYWHAYQAARAKQRAARDLAELNRIAQWRYAMADAMLRERMTVREGSPRAA